jgi:hypothetical protein
MDEQDTQQPEVKEADPVWAALAALKSLLASAPEVHEVLARPMVYEAWLAKAKEALNA